MEEKFINKSATITALDIVKLRALILHIDDELANNTSWRFVDQNYVFTNVNNPLADNFNEYVALDGTTNAPVNFTAVKVGDVNGTASPNSLLGTERARSCCIWMKRNGFYTNRHSYSLADISSTIIAPRWQLPQYRKKLSAIVIFHDGR